MPLDRLRNESILQRADVAAVAVDTGRGAHVTVQAYAWSAGRLWLIAPTDSAKVRALRKRSGICISVRHGDDSVVLAGEAELIDAWPPRPGVASPRLPLGLAWYFTRNAALTGGIITDVITGDMENVTARTIICITPKRSLTLVGNAVVAESGSWQPTATKASTRRPHLLPSATAKLPLRASQLLASATGASVGWLTPGGPIVVPSVVHEGVATLSSSVVERTGRPSGPGAITVHDSKGNRPSRYAGVMLRGAIGSDRAAAVTMTVERVTWWDGYRSETVSVS